MESGPEGAVEETVKSLGAADPETDIVHKTEAPSRKIEGKVQETVEAVDGMSTTTKETDPLLSETPEASFCKIEKDVKGADGAVTLNTKERPESIVSKTVEPEPLGP